MCRSGVRGLRDCGGRAGELAVLLVSREFYEHTLFSSLLVGCIWPGIDICLRG